MIVQSTVRLSGYSPLGSLRALAFPYMGWTAKTIPQRRFQDVQSCTVMHRAWTHPHGRHWSLPCCHWAVHLQLPQQWLPPQQQR